MSKTSEIIQVTKVKSKKEYRLEENSFKELMPFLFEMANKIDTIYFENHCATDIIISEDAICEIEEKVDMWEEYGEDFNIFEATSDYNTAKKLIEIWETLPKKANELIYECIQLH